MANPSPFRLAKRKAQLLEPSATHTEALELADHFAAAKEAFKEIEEAYKSSLVQWCKRNGALFHPATKKKYYAGHHTDTKRVADNEDILREIVSVAGGEWNEGELRISASGLVAVLESLSSDAFKQGTVKGILGQEIWERLYEQKKKWKLVPKAWDGKRGEELRFVVEEVLRECRER